MAALLLLLLRKASSLSSPVVHLATRPLAIGPLGFSSSFSTSSPVDDNLVQKIEGEMAGYSNGLHMPKGFPFYLNASVASRYVYMSRRYEKEIITVVINGDDPAVPINVLINTMDVEVSSTMSAKHNQLDIHEVTVTDKDHGMDEYVQYLRTKGIMPETMLHLYGFMGFKI